VEETSVTGNKTIFKHKEHTYILNARKCMQDMGTWGNVSSKDTSVKSQRKILQGYKLTRIHKKNLINQQVEADINPKSESGKDAMQLQINTKVWEPHGYWK